LLRNMASARSVVRPSIWPSSRLPTASSSCLSMGRTLALRQQAENILGAAARLAQRPNRRGLVALGQALAVRPGEQWVMGVTRCRESQQLLQQDVDVGGGQKILAAR